MKENIPFLYEICIASAVALVGGWISWVDLKTKEIPNLALGFLTCLIVPWAFIKGDFISHLLAALLSVSLMVGFVFFFFKKNNVVVLGGGDIKLIALFSFLLGFQKLAPFFILSGLLGVLVLWLSHNKKAPFAPFLFISFFMSEFLDVAP